MDIFLISSKSKLRCSSHKTFYCCFYFLSFYFGFDKRGIFVLVCGMFFPEKFAKGSKCTMHFNSFFKLVMYYKNIIYTNKDRERCIKLLWPPWESSADLIINLKISWLLHTFWAQSFSVSLESSSEMSSVLIQKLILSYPSNVYFPRWTFDSILNRTH